MYEKHKLLVANRGEIAVRIIRTAKEEGLATVALYTASDALSPHVGMADEAVFLSTTEETMDDSQTTESESQAYLSGPLIVSISPEFAQAVLDAGVTWLGPNPSIIKTMGLKHLAREAGPKVGVNPVPGSEGLVDDATAAVEVSSRIGYPLMIKAAAGGGGMGMVICEDEHALLEGFTRSQKACGIFIERYVSSARHIEIQIFGNGLGDVVCMGERECSIQRRHQKIIEETPSPFFATRPQLRTRMCEAAVRSLPTRTVEFLVDDNTSEFFFLEMNTRIQVEHAITEAIHPGLDLVKLMIQQGVAEASGLHGLARDSVEMQQATYDALLKQGSETGVGYAMEARVYAENPAELFRPCPGILQYISTGTTVTPFFDPLLCKLVVSAETRALAISQIATALEESKIQGPTNNREYLQAIVGSEMFHNGGATTTFLASFQYTPHAMTVLASALEMTVQDFPGRTIRLGIPRSGPMDSMAFRAGNILVDNPPETEGLEMIALGGLKNSFQFHVPTVVAVTGKLVSVKLTLTARTTGQETGMRVYLSIRGGFPLIPKYLGSKSTSMGLGGYQGRSLVVGDEIALARECGPKQTDASSRPIPSALIPVYPKHFIIYVLAGPHDDQEYVTPEGISKFYSTHWRVSPSSNRLGIRLDGPEKIIWARLNGGAGGSHPSNILDNGYALGTININGDTPVILGNEGPDMGGYVCMCTVASADMWKLGQLSPGCTVEFRRVSWAEAVSLEAQTRGWLENIKAAILGQATTPQSYPELGDRHQDPKLCVITRTDNNPAVVFRQAGDSAILVEYGDMTLDFHLRARVHAFEAVMKQRKIPGNLAFCPCVRSTMCHFDPSMISQSAVLETLIDAQRAIPTSMNEMSFKGRKLTFPIVLDDQWSRDALKRYMNSIRDKAIYLPSNIDYLARNNGLQNAEEVLHKLTSSDWLVFGVGFYLACPFLIPIDPRCRLVAQKMNPSRTYTPQGAVGIAGVVAAIYPIVSPGGYMLYGRSLPAWQAWGKGPDFSPDRPWLLEPFDQIESQFNSGRYAFKIEETVFSMAEYTAFKASIAEELTVFEEKQKQGVQQEEIKEQEILRQWESEKMAHLGDLAEDEVILNGSAHITASLFGNVWKILCRPGDIITSGDTTLVILEAMKTEIAVKAGEANIGKNVLGLGRGVREGSNVCPGDVLVVLGDS
ncbi:allophanate hydrolase subunit 2-domain-containing protein [Mycena rebaudengoi]|nr:allophanate hydrolase subunit 2-domain-containing protein [Mycena rebaudengoi]